MPLCSAGQAVSAVPRAENRPARAMRMWIFGWLPVQASGGEARTEDLPAAHPCLGPASGMGSGPALPGRSTGVPGSPPGFVSGRRHRASRLSRSTATRDRSCSCRQPSMTAARHWRRLSTQPAAERRLLGHRPVQIGRLPDPGLPACGQPRRRPEQNPDRQVNGTILARRRRVI